MHIFFSVSLTRIEVEDSYNKLNQVEILFHRTHKSGKTDS